MDATTTHPLSSSVPVVYATNWCPYCMALLAGLKMKKVPHEVVDVDKDESAGAWVSSVNGGNRIVPTVYMPDGTVLTNPSAETVAKGMSS